MKLIIYKWQTIIGSDFIVLTHISMVANWKAALTRALVSLRVALWYGAPGVSSILPSLGALWIGRPVVVGAPRGVRVPHRPGIITVASLEETERENERDERGRGMTDQAWTGRGERERERENTESSRVWSLFNETPTGVLKQHAFSNTRCTSGLCWDKSTWLWQRSFVNAA